MDFDYWVAVWTAYTGSLNPSTTLTGTERLQTIHRQLRLVGLAGVLRRRRPRWKWKAFDVRSAATEVHRRPTAKSIRCLSWYIYWPRNTAATLTYRPHHYTANRTRLLDIIGNVSWDPPQSDGELRNNGRRPGQSDGDGRRVCSASDAVSARPDAA